MKAAEALGKIKDPSAVEPLIAALKDEDPGVRWDAANAPGEIGDTRAVEPLIAALKDLDVREAAAVALAEIKDTRGPLTAALKDKDFAIVAEVYDFLIRIGASGTEAVLIKALNKYGYEGMALNFLNCGNSKLYDAASSWAKRHGYTILHKPGGGGHVWGRRSN